MSEVQDDVVCSENEMDLTLFDGNEIEDDEWSSAAIGEMAGASFPAGPPIIPVIVGHLLQQGIM